MKKRTVKGHILIVGLILISTTAISQNELGEIHCPTVIKNDKAKRISQDSVLYHCEVMPEYPGGTDSLFKFIRKNLKYPVCTCDPWEGRIIVRFVISREGKLINPQIKRGGTPETNKEAIRLVNILEGWTAGKQNGKEVDCYYTIPITFRRE